MNDRQKRQLDFLNSNENVIVGDIAKLPIPLDLIINPKKMINLGYVEKTFKNGLTAIVYKLNINGKLFNLKIKRETSLVKNVDGQTSFLNEVQRRKDFEELRKTNSVINEGIVRTVYANYKMGFMLSEWIDGEEPKEYTREVLGNLFELTWNIEKNGIMEWDLCSGNLLIKNDKVTLFDFGYAYRHNPLTEFNSEGRAVPEFNSVERFETRAFIPYLLDQEEQEIKQVMEIYKVEKEEAIKIFHVKLKWLKDNLADQDIISTCYHQIERWKLALSSDEELRKLYMIESTRSYFLDIYDDIGGQSCSTHTLKKIEKVIEIINNHYDFLSLNDVFFQEDNVLSKDDLLDKYKDIYNLAVKYQL